ncbi:MAG: hypothetical protein JWO03_4106, partial [Bacteroidetes bacterium]|nr:hypothetical protein [Bacteroidota bacterium]
MKKIYTAVIAIICCFGWVSDVRASHAQGADLTYRFISYNPGTGQSTYEVTATEYRDCTGIPADASMTLNVTNTGCAGGSYSTNFNMPMINGLPCPYGGVSTSGSGCEVSQLCPADLSQSTCSGGTFPGVQKYVYRTTITLPGNGTAANLCNQWLLSITISARNPSSNLATTGNLYIESLINNTIDPTTSLPYVNSSVTFGYDPVPFVCDTFPISYNNGAVDANGDSLVFQLITPLQGHNNPLSFNFGYTQNRPIIVRNNLFAFDVASGQIDFTPGQTDVDVLAIRVLEYRNGVLVGSVIRDVQVKILNCNVPAAIQFPISNTNNANPLDTVSLQLCPGTTASWDIQMASANGAAIVILSNLLGNPSPLPGATLTTVTTTPSLKTAHITWTPQISDTGCHYYQLTTNTQDCPVEGNFTKSYRVCVYNKVTVSPHEAIYCGTPIQLAATGGTNSTWAPTTGLTFPTGLFTPLAAPSVTTRYTFTSDCGTDTSLIIFNPPFTMDAGPGGSICQNGALQLNASVDNLYAPYQILWTPSADLTDPVSHAQTDSILNPIASPSVTTTYTVQFTANTGCVRTDTVKVVVNGHAPALQASADPTSICPGQQTQLRVTANPDCGLATIPCTGNSTPIIVGTGNTNQGGSQSLYPSPYGNYYKSARHQYLFHANEISSMLGSGGQISQIALYIGTLNQGSTLTNFTIRMGCVPTTIDSLDGYVNDTYLSTVYVFDYTPVAGWNNHVLQTPYNWDGVSNLVVDVCFHNTPSNNINNKMKYTVTPFKSVWCTYGNAPAGQCGFTGSQQGIATTYASLFQRPNFRFTFCTTPVDSPHLVWTSSTGIAPVPPSGSATPIGSPLDQTTYHVTLTDTNGCTSTDYVTVYVDTSNRFKLDPDTFICSISPVQLHAKATGNTNPDSLTYTWTSNPPGTAPISGKGLIRANPIVTPTVTTLYTCVITGGGLGCILSDTARVTIGNNIPVNKVVDSITCAGNDGRIIINMNAGTSPYTYTWSPAVAGNPSTISNLGPNTYYLTVVDNIGCSGHDTTTLIAPVPLALTLDSTDVACFGAATGTVTAIVTGGRAPYRYTWSPAQSNTNTLTGLLAGTYRLTVTDTSGCTITGQIIVNQPPVLTSYAIKTNLTGAGTNDGTVKVHQTGGTGPYTYTWTPPVVGNVDTACCLSAGTYIIRVCDSKGCCVQDTAIITVPPPINVVFTLGNVSCFGVCDGSASAVATGGVQPYTYAWSTTPVSNNDTILNICAGSYTLTVTDSNGITVSNTIVIVSPTPIDIAIDSTPITCFGANNGALDATPSGGTPGYTVNWSAGADPLTGLSPGMYIVTVTDAANCVAKDTAYLGQPTQVVATIASTDSVKCFGQSNGVARVSATGGRPPYTYLWTGSAS